MIDRISNESRESFIKSIMTALVCAAMLSSHLLFVGVNIAKAQRGLSRKDNQRITKYRGRINQFKSLGRNYSGAMNTVRTLSTKRLTTESELKSAVNALNRQKRTLQKGSYPSLVSMAVNNAGFKKSVETKVDQMGAKKLQIMLKRNPKMAVTFTNGKQLQTQMKRMMAQQAGYLNKLGNKLKAAPKLRRNTRNTRNTRSGIFKNNASFQITNASYNVASNNSSVDMNETFDAKYLEEKEFEIATAAYLKRRDAGATIIIALSAAAVLLIGVYANAKAQDFEEKEVPPGADPGTFDTRSEFKRCTDKADSERDSCLRTARGDFFRAAGCWGIYTLEMAECIILPQ